MGLELSRAQELALESAPLLGILSPTERAKVVELFSEKRFAFGDVVIAEGAPAVAFHLVVSGRLRVVKQSRGGDELSLAVLKAGDSFGERALLEGGTHSATVRCSSDAELLVLAAQDFRALVARSPHLEAELELVHKQRTLHNFLREFSRLGKLPLPVLRALLERMEERAVEKGALMFRAGDPAGPFFVIRSGKVRVFTEEAGRERNLSFLRAGASFGELKSQLVKNDRLEGIREELRIDKALELVLTEAVPAS